MLTPSAKEALLAQAFWMADCSSVICGSKAGRNKAAPAKSMLGNWGATLGVWAWWGKVGVSGGRKRAGGRRARVSAKRFWKPRPYPPNLVPMVTGPESSLKFPNLRTCYLGTVPLLCVGWILITMLNWDSVTDVDTHPAQLTWWLILRKLNNRVSNQNISFKAK